MVITFNLHEGVSKMRLYLQLGSIRRGNMFYKPQMCNTSRNITRISSMTLQATAATRNCINKDPTYPIQNHNRSFFGQNSLRMESHSCSASPLLTRTTASTSTQWHEPARTTYTQAICVAIERKPHHRKAFNRTSAGHMALSDYHTAVVHTLSKVRPSDYRRSPG
jgi:hypothetical protein